MKIKKGDKVKVITGHYKGTIGEVLAVMPKQPAGSALRSKRAKRSAYSRNPATSSREVRNNEPSC